MSIVLGMDMGISTCKIAGFKEESPLIPLQSFASDKMALSQLFDLFLSSNNILKTDIDKIMITGVGSSLLEDCILEFTDGSITPVFVPEFYANANYGTYCCHTDNFTVISMGTGTSYIHVCGDIKEHLGGIALGGGTIKGLSLFCLGTDDYSQIKELSLQGNVANIDLRMADITKDEIPGLPPEITASNFGKAEGIENRADIAAGIVHLIIENSLQTGALISKPLGIKELIIIGGLADYPQCREICGLLKLLHSDITFTIPENPLYGSAYGAALEGLNHN